MKDTAREDELFQRMAKHVTSVVFDQIDNNGEWMMTEEIAEHCVGEALGSWWGQAYAAGRAEGIEEAAQAADNEDDTGLVAIRIRALAKDGQ